MTLSDEEDRSASGSLRQEVDRLFEQYFRRWPAPWTRSPSDLEPLRISSGSAIRETEGEFEVSVEVPTVSKEDLRVSVSETSVTISAEETKIRTVPGHVFRTETGFGCFQRVIPLPGRVEPGKATATLHGNRLLLVLPKLRAPKSTRLRIEIED